MALIGMGGFVSLLTLMQEKLIYHPREYTSSYQPYLDKVQPLVYSTSQGRQTAYLWPPSTAMTTPTSRLWLLFGGNATLALDWFVILEELARPGEQFLLIDYPSYGPCEGKPNPASILESSQAAYNKALEVGKLNQGSLILGTLGHSLGAAAAAQFAAQQPAKALIMLSPFTSILDMACRMVGKPLCYLVKHRFDNVARLDEILSAPHPPQVVLMHGNLDYVVPVQMSREMAERFGPQVTYHELDDVDHADIIQVALKRIRQAMDEAAFLKVEKGG